MLFYTFINKTNRLDLLPKLPKFKQNLALSKEQLPKQTPSVNFMAIRFWHKLC